MQYKVMQQYGRGSNILIAQFKDAGDAAVFIQAKLKTDREKITYQLYEFDDLLQEFKPGETNANPTSEPEPSTSTASSSSSRTPFPTAPRPPGMPQTVRQPEEDKNK